MSENREAVWEKFYKEVYVPEIMLLGKQIYLEIEQNRQVYAEQFREMIKEFIRNVKGYDFIIAQPIGCIEVSLLRYSVYGDKLKFSFEAFDSKQDLGDCLAGYVVEKDWFTKEWEQHKTRLLAAREKEEWVRFVRKADIYIMLQDSLKSILNLLVSAFKYELEGCELWSEYEDLNISKEFFCITLGEYRDWQIILFAERPPYDIFMVDQKETCRFSKFSSCIYTEKNIVSRDFRSSLFDECVFEKTNLHCNKLEDCRFYNCTFYDCDFTESDFTGCVFIQCKFDECHFTDVVWNNADRVDGVYRQTYLADSSFTRCNVLQNDIEQSGAILDAVKFIEGERS